jgi:hypothetical protein
MLLSSALVPLGCSADEPAPPAVLDAPAQTVLVRDGSRVLSLKVAWAFHNNVDSSFRIEASVDGVAGSEPTMSLALGDGALPGSVTCTEGGLGMLYRPDPDHSYAAPFGDSLCYIEVTNWGSVGAVVVGRFAGTLHGADGSRTIDGAFNLIREGNQ